MEEVIIHMANGKAAGPDGIPNELIKYGGTATKDTEYGFTTIYRMEERLSEKMK